MNILPGDSNRRAVLHRLASGGAVLAGVMGTTETSPQGFGPAASASEGWFDVKVDFKAWGNGSYDDTRALQAAIVAGSESQRPVRVPPGVYRTTSPLVIPSNTMLIGSTPGLDFGCRIEPNGCPALVIGGKDSSFHCSIENLMIWPRGSAPNCVISIDNSYSVSFRNIRLHNAQDHLSRAAVLLLGDMASGGHGPSNNIIWDNLIVRNDAGQPGIAVLASKGCGSHRFNFPDLENYAVLLEWQGGQIDMVAPYTERAGRYGVNCNLDVDDDASYLNTFGGIIEPSNSGTACAIRSTTRNFNSFGTVWGRTADSAAYVYSLPNHPVNFHGMVPNLTTTGKGRFSGVDGWLRHVRFPQHILRESQVLEVEVPVNGRKLINMRVPGVTVAYWARVSVNADLFGIQLNAFVSAPDTATIVAQNFSEKQIKIRGVFTVECGIA